MTLNWTLFTTVEYKQSNQRVTLSPAVRCHRYRLITDDPEKIPSVRCTDNYHHGEAWVLHRRLSHCVGAIGVYASEKHWKKSVGKALDDGSDVISRRLL